jgi:hypothetical protein
MIVSRPLMYVVMSGVLNVVSMRGVSALVAERPRGGFARLFGGIGKDMTGVRLEQESNGTVGNAPPSP